MSDPKKPRIPLPLPLPTPEPETAAAGAVGRGVDDEEEEGGEEGRPSGDRLFLFGDRLRRRDEPYDAEEEDEDNWPSSGEGVREGRLSLPRERERGERLPTDEEERLEEEEELDDEEEDELDDEEDLALEVELLELAGAELLEVDCALAAVGAAGPAGLRRKRSISPVTFCFFGAPLVVAGVARFFPLLFPFLPLPLRWRGKEKGDGAKAWPAPIGIRAKSCPRGPSGSEAEGALAVRGGTIADGISRSVRVAGTAAGGRGTSCRNARSLLGEEL